MNTPEQNAITEYELNKPPYISGDTLVIDYMSSEQPTPDTTFRFCKILMVQRGNYNQVQFLNNEEATTIPVKTEATA